MAKGSKKSSAAADPIVNICQNRRARHEYEIHDSIECGIVLLGTEVKSLRAGTANLEDAYARIENNELWLMGAEIAEYSYGNRMNHEPKRDRKLLLRKSELAKFAGKASVKGFTLIPLRMYFKEGRAKVEIAVGRGKQVHDKRESLKKSEAKREMDRAAAESRRRRS
jgi:SsrA-binding protein